MVTQKITKIVSDSTSSREQGQSAEVPDWQPSRTLLMLRELLDVASAATPAVARRAGLSVSELSALELLMAGEHGPTDLARRLGVTSAASSGIVDRLVARGHAVRRPDEVDGRRTRVMITEGGRVDVLRQLMPMFAALAEMDATFTDEERAVVERYLRGAIEATRRLL